MTASMHVHHGEFNGQYYLGEVSAYYAKEGGEPPGFWLGRGAESLGLRGTVQAEDFRSLLANAHPITGKPLAIAKFGSKKQASSDSKAGGRHRSKQQPDSNSETEIKPRLRNGTVPDQHMSTDPPKTPRARKRDRKSVAAVDITFSWRKEISILWGMSDDKTRAVMDAAAHDAIRSVLTWFEAEVPLSRFGKMGREKVLADLAIAVFDHATNRAGQVSKHSHCVITAVCRRQDGTWARLGTAVLRSYVRTLGPMFQAEFAFLLRERLGIALERTDAKNEPVVPGQRVAPSLPQYGLRGMSRTLIERFSDRRREILDYLAGHPELSGNHSAQARAKAAERSRGAKAKTPSRDQLREQTIATAATEKFRPKVAQRLLGRARPGNVDRAYRKARDRAIARLEHSESSFTLRELACAIAEEIQTVGIKARDLMQRVTHDLYHDPRFRPLGVRDQEMRYTTRATWKEEKKLLGTVERLAARRGFRIPPRIIRAVLAKNSQLSREQRRAAERILRGKGDLQLLTGVAGSGKSQTMAPIRQALERAGYQCLGTAMAGAAAEELAAKTSIPCRTVASLLYTADQQAKRWLNKGKDGPLLHKNVVVIVDEIGMLDTRTMRRLLDHCRRSGAKLIGLGDSRQLPPIEAGGPLERIKKMVQNAHLVKNQRQLSRADQKAAVDLRRGQSEMAIDTYRKRKRLFVGADRAEAAKKLVDDWSRRGGAKAPQDHLIFVQTRREAKALNTLCQRERIAQSSKPNLKSVLFNEERFMAGDRVLFRQKQAKLGIQSGYRGTIVSVSPLWKTITVRLDQPPPKASNAGVATRRSQTVVVPLGSLRADGVTLGYAATTHAMQGQSVKCSYVLLGGRMSSREMTYTQLTRGKFATRLYTSQAEVGEGNKQLAQSMRKSVGKDLAHDIAEPLPSKATRVSKAAPSIDLRATALTTSERALYAKHMQPSPNVRVTGSPENSQASGKPPRVQREPASESTSASNRGQPSSTATQRPSLEIER